MSIRRLLAVVASSLAFAPGVALADDPPAPFPVDVRADEVELNARTQAIEARGNVRVDVPPFFLTSDEVALRRVGIGVELDGQGRLGFCGCLGTPLALSFRGATVAPPHDVIVRSARLEVLGVPVLWAPIFWMRSPARRGLLAPEIAYRGSDGLFLGEGVHLPLHEGTSTEGGLDLRAGAYVKGGAAVDAHLYTPTSTTRVRWDRLRSDGVAVDARGATSTSSAPSAESPSVAWDVDVVRGVRGVLATTDLDAAARPYDRAAMEGAWRAHGWTIATAVRSIASRGGDVLDLGAVGPIATVRRAAAIGGFGAYDATVDGGVLRGAGVPPLSFARADAGALFAARAGGVGVSLDLRGVADVASDGVARGLDAAGSARARVALPLVRGFASNDVEDPWVHRIEPRVDVAAIGLRSDGVLGAAFARGASAIAPGVAWTATGGVASAVGRWGARGSVEIDVAAGVVGDAERTWPAMRERASLAGPWVGVSGEAAHVVASGASGHAVAARARVGRVDGPNVGAVLAGRDGVDPIRARALVDAPLEPSSGFLAAEAWTGGARLAIPWSRAVVTRGGADADLATGRLVAASGAVELRDGCGCLVVRATGAHRLGRDGVDVWLTVDLPHAL